MSVRDRKRADLAYLYVQYRVSYVFPILEETELVKDDTRSMCKLCTYRPFIVVMPDPYIFPLASCMRCDFLLFIECQGGFRSHHLDLNIGVLWTAYSASSNLVL